MDYFQIIILGIFLLVVIYFLLNKSPDRHVLETLNKIETILHQRLDNQTQILMKNNGIHNILSEKLGELQEANKKIYDIGKSIGNLENILRSPKLRGNIGELLLSEILGNLLPTNNYELQYVFHDKSIVDAVIKLADGTLVCIDSKFPLENFVKTFVDIESLSAEEESRYFKMFEQDVKKHIDNISQKYIKPAEKTLEFAMMYVPAENVYYQAFIKSGSNLATYAYQKKVFPVSPNTLTLYLESILIGLKGLELQQETKDLLRQIGTLENSLNKTKENLQLASGHVKNAYNAFDNLNKNFDQVVQDWQKMRK